MDHLRARLAEYAPAGEANDAFSEDLPRRSTDPGTPEHVQAWMSPNFASPRTLERLSELRDPRLLALVYLGCRNPASMTAAGSEIATMTPEVQAAVMMNATTPWTTAMESAAESISESHLRRVYIASEGDHVAQYGTDRHRLVQQLRDLDDDAHMQVGQRRGSHGRRRAAYEPVLGHRIGALINCGQTAGSYGMDEVAGAVTDLGPDPDVPDLVGLVLEDGSAVCPATCVLAAAFSDAFECAWHWRQAQMFIEEGWELSLSELTATVIATS